MKIVKMFMVVLMLLFSVNTQAESRKELKEIFDSTAGIVKPYCEMQENYKKCMKEEFEAFVELIDLEPTLYAKVKENAFVEASRTDNNNNLIYLDLVEYVKLAKLYQSQVQFNDKIEKEFKMEME
jgi:hypothetical protein